MSHVIIIPNRFPDVIQPLLFSLKLHEPNTPVLIIADGHTEDYGYTAIPYTEPEFCYSKAINQGVKMVMTMPNTPDIVLLNDDCVLLSPLDRLGEYLKAVQPVGLISPLIKGCVGNCFQRFHEKSRWWKVREPLKLIWDPDPVCFPCVYIRNSAVKNTGYMNENIPGYGFDDNEYCTRLRYLGWWTAVTSDVIVQHGDGTPALSEGRGRSWSVSFGRRYPNIIK